MSLFPYPALTTDVDAIRILTLLPGAFSDSLVGTLSPVLFSDRPKYIALSYTWGFSYPDNSKVPISYHDSTGTPGLITINHESLLVRRNLYLALLHLRSITQPITLWVDAICINQADTDERNRQVSLMSFIYTRATMVISWLGVKKYSRATGIFRTMSFESRLGQAQHLATALANDNTMRCSPRPTRSTIIRIAESAYWSRLWVVQEVCLPRLLFFVYGAEIWACDDFRQWVPVIPNGFRAMLQLLETREKRHTDMMRLETLVERFTSSKCLELRDRVFGLIGCANDIHPFTAHKSYPNPSNCGVAPLPESHGAIGSLCVDYSLSFCQIWANLIKLIFQARSIGGRFKAKHELSQGRTGLLMNEERAISIVRTACMIQNALGQRLEEEIVSRNHTIDDPTIIRAVGYIAGRVLRLGPECGALIGSSQAQQEWASSWPELYQKADDLEMLRRMSEDFTADLLSCKQSDIDRVRRTCSAPVTAEPVTLSEDTLGRIRESQSSILDEEISANIPAENREPRICLGTGYVMGLVPSAAETGDIIVRFWDCDAAVVMRPLKTIHTDTEKAVSWNLIGRAKVADVCNRRSTPGYDVRAEQCLRGIAEPGLSEKLPGYFGAVYVNFDLPTLQIVTACTTT
ncbi:heterokaryon incompatibility protein-domain-containing protein [Xylaria arbuscula]|nr:heterokaryon incompatibility protein-domain-containing protein [Xylaria arbuscula]